LVLAQRTRNLERVVFTATTGRSGTLALAKLLAKVPGCVSLHEPYPIMNDEILKATSYADEAAADWMYRRVKSVNILRASAGRRYYVEANHLFVKTFLRQAVEEFKDRLAVVHLVRSPIDVAMSLYCLDELPGTEIAKTWWLDHRAPTNVIQISQLLDGDGEWAHPFFKGLWYWYEVELRFAAWRARFPTMKVVRFETEWLNDGDRVFHMLDELGMDYVGSKVAEAVGRKEHLCTESKVRPPIARAEAEQMDMRFRRLLAERGLTVATVQRFTGVGMGSGLRESNCAVEGRQQT
jgi:hypothetical protein